MNETEKTQYQGELLKNRIIKRYKHLKKWAKRTNVTCFRLYDKDIPEIPLAIDLFEVDYCESDSSCVKGTLFVQIALYDRPYEKSETEEEQWLLHMKQVVSETLSIPCTSIITKTRKQQKGESQYEKLNNQKLEFIVTENLHRFKVNLSDYIDTGLFFDHRPLRLTVEQTAMKKNVLNLFCYTGAFSVYAACGNASSVTSVDLSNTYLAWAKENMAMNGFAESKKYKFVASDVKTFLENAKSAINVDCAGNDDCAENFASKMNADCAGNDASKMNADCAENDARAKNPQKYDIIILDPPTFSNSKKTATTLDINRDWPELVNLCISLLAKDGVLYFSTNSKKLKFDEKLLLPSYCAKEITMQTIPEDFRNEKIHRVWEIYEQRFF